MIELVPSLVVSVTIHATHQHLVHAGQPWGCDPNESNGRIAGAQQTARTGAQSGRPNIFVQFRFVHTETEAQSECYAWFRADFAGVGHRERFAT